LEQAQAEVKKVLGEKAVLVNDPKDFHGCIEGYKYESPDNREYSFRFLKGRLYDVIISYKDFLSDNNLPQTLLDILTEKYGKRSKFDAEFNKNRRWMNFCTSTWDEKSAVVKIDAVSIVGAEAGGKTYFVEFTVDKIGDRKTEEIFIECESGKEYHEAKEPWEIKKSDFKKDF
jgi:hypothetical protein